MTTHSHELEPSASGEMSEAFHDVVAVGCGPFNLGLAALATRIQDLDLVAFELRTEMRWHPGLMFDDALLQLSFLADLVTLVDPTHPLSFLAYLRDVDRLYPFFIREQFHPTRREYEDYLRWAAAKLPTLRFGQRVASVAWDERRARFALDVERPHGEHARVFAKDLVIGVGTEPFVPESLCTLPAARRLHSADYLARAADIDAAPHVSVVGSGQSGAEVVLDLLRRNLAGGPGVTWLTRTATFAPLDYTKLALEMTTPAYIRYFHGLPQAVKDRLNREQWMHYKGISSETLAQIHGLLYERTLRTGLAPVELRCGVEVLGASADASSDVVLSCRQRDTERRFEQRTSLVITATGYRERNPTFLEALGPWLRRDERGRYRVRLDYSIELDRAISGRIFVANAELHSHGVATPDLGVAAYRNATILNTITKREFYALPQRTAFTSFEMPSPAPTSPATAPSTHLKPALASSASAEQEVV